MLWDSRHSVQHPSSRRTQVPRTRHWQAVGTRHVRKSGEPLGFRAKQGTCASTGAHTPGVTHLSRWRQLVRPLLPGAALLGAISQV